MLLVSLLGELAYVLRNRQGQQTTGLAEIQPPVPQHVLHILRKLQETHVIRYRRAIAARALPDLLLREAEFLAEAGKRLGLLVAVQVLALQVLDDGHLRSLLVGDVADDRGNLRFAGEL